MPYFPFWLAQAAPGAGGSNMMQFIMLFGVLGVIWWVLVLGPENKRKKQHQLMLDSLKKGDRVITAGGIHGRVVAAKDTIVVLSIADNVKIEINRNAISTVVTADSARGGDRADKGDKSDRGDKSDKGDKDE